MYEDSQLTAWLTIEVCMVEDQSSANELAEDSLSNRQAGTFQITKGEPELILALVLPLRDLVEHGSKFQ